MRPSARSITMAALLCLAMPLAWATNPNTPPGGKSYGDSNAPSDQTQDPSQNYPDSGDSGEGNGSGTSGGKKDCDGTNSPGDSNSNNDDCEGCQKPPTEPPAPSCIRELVTLAFAPNDNGLGSGALQLYIDATSPNLGARTYLEFFGIPYMAATKVQDLGAVTTYQIMQAGGSNITFSIDENQTVGQSGYLIGHPIGGESYSQARVTYVTSTGAPATKATAARLRQYRAGAGYVEYLVNGGKAVRFVTNEGRVYNLPFAGVETIRERANGTYVVNGNFGDGVIRQAKALAGLLDVVPLGERSYEVRKYAPSQVGAKDGTGLYTVTGTPYFTMKVESPANQQNTLIVTKTSGSQQTITTHECNTDPVVGETWKQTVQKGAFIYERVLSRIPQGALGPDYRSSSWTARLLAAPGMTIPANPPADYQISSTTYKYATLSSSQSFKNGASYQRTRAYSKPDWDVNGVGRETSQTKSSGTQLGYEIDPATQRMLSRTWAVTVPAGGGSAPTERKEVFSYEPFAPGEEVLPFDFRPRMTGKFQDGVLTNRTYFSFRTEAGEYVQTKEDAATVNAGWGNANSRRTESRYYGSGVNQGRLKEVRHDDGTLIRYDYAAQPNGQLLVTTTNKLTPLGSPLNGHSTRTKELRDVRGWVLEATHAHWVSGAWLDYETIYQTYNLAGKLTGCTRKDLLTNQQRVLLEQQWDGEVLIRRVDELGVATANEYFTGTDILHVTTREAIAAQGSFAAQPAVVTTLSGTFTLRENQTPEWEQKVETTTSGGLSLARTTVFDDIGRSVSETNENGYTTQTAYNATGTLVTTTLPSGGTKIRATTSEGLLLRSAGTAVVPEYYHYEPLVAGGIRKTVYVGQDAGPRWMTTEFDPVGRTARILRPAFGGTTSETVYGYENGCSCGKPTLITATGNPATVYQYNSVNELVRTGITGDNLTLELNSTTDSIQDSETKVELSGGLLWEVRRGAVYDQSGSAAPKTVATSKQLLAGFAGTEIVVSELLDVAGNTSRTVLELDRAAHMEVRRETRPGMTDAQLRIKHAGRTVAEHHSGSNGDVIYTLDALGRSVATQHPGQAHSHGTAYIAGTNLVASKTDASGASTGFTYVSQGQAGAGLMQSITAPDGGVTSNVYDLSGRVIRASGVRVYPVDYTYTMFGQMETMTTWQDYAGQQGTAVTRWEHDVATGLLAKKSYTPSQGVSFSYDVAGRMTSRTWARGVVTTYVYDPITQNLATVEYSDGTPAVDYTYDRMGRPTVITADRVAQTEYTYDVQNLLVSTEAVQQDLDGDGAVDFLRIFERDYDTSLRTEGFALKDALNNVELTAGYNYEVAAGRVAGVTGQTGVMAARTFNYNYDAARPKLVSLVSGPVHTVSNTWDADRNILDAKTNRNSGGTVVSSFDYEVNSVGQRSSVATGGSAFAASSGWNWGYDSLGQLASATHLSNGAFNESFSYDNIGNRRERSVGAASPKVISYSVNLLNQFTLVESIGVPPQVPSYDADGNLLTSGQVPGMTFEWDGENRLKSVRDGAGTLVATYGYDSHSRLARVITPSGVMTYVYDGWNCVSEYSSATLAAAPSLRRTYMWGLDLSGTIEGGGGVGGLLAVSHAATGTVSYPAYDGNGNISEYIDAGGGVDAHFEYDSYGTAIVANGNAAAYDIRFSTKRLDSVSGAYYHGYRFYDPDSGRWMSRDPIGINGGRNLFAMVGNDLINYCDPHGLLEVNFSPAGAENAPVVYKSLGGETPGQTTYTGNVSCHCEQKEKKKPCIMKCDVTFNATIEIDSDWSGLGSEPTRIKGRYNQRRVSMDEVYGHEQRHIQDRQNKVQGKVVDPLKAEKGEYSTKSTCDKAASDLENQYNGIMKNNLNPKILPSHDTDDTTLAPEGNVPYPPLPGSTTTPPAVIFPALPNTD